MKREQEKRITDDPAANDGLAVNAGDDSLAAKAVNDDLAVKAAVKAGDDGLAVKAANDGSGEEHTLTLPLRSLKEAGLPQRRQLSSEEQRHYRGMMEAVIFSSVEPVSLTLLASFCNLHRADARELVDQLMDDYNERDGGIQLREIAAGYQFLTSENYVSVMQQIHKRERQVTLSRSMMETLSIICYRQPITLPEIERIRGMNSRAMVVNLLERKLIKPQGRRPVPGRPTLYATTHDFLKHFALGSLADLPPLPELKEVKFDDFDNVD